VRDVGAFSGSIIRAYKNPSMCRARSLAKALLALLRGLGVGALPNGRKAKEPLNDGLFRHAWSGQAWPDGVLRSALKAGFKESYASCLNQKFSGTVMQSLESREKLATLTDTFFRNGGQHIQYNLVDKDELLDAKIIPRTTGIWW